jgi:hypothetical protein
MPVKKKVKPQRWVECVVYCSAQPAERISEVVALRHRYRVLYKAGKRGPAMAGRLARREASYWIIRTWPERLFKIVRAIFGGDPPLN